MEDKLQLLRTFGSYFLFLTAAIIGSSSATCVWNFRNTCSIACRMTNAELLASELAVIVEEEPHCDQELSLKLYDCIFPKSAIVPNWLDTNIKVSGLVIRDLRSIAFIETDAFIDRTFKNLESLELTNMELEYMHVGMFNGLQSLRTLHVTQMKFKYLEADCLRAVPHLRSILFEAINDDVTNIRNLSGTTDLGLIQIVSLRENNFGDTIDDKTFLGLRNVKSLYLTNSKISSIGPKTFNVMQKSIQFIDLRENHLQSLPSEIFLPLLIRNDVKILLTQNLWNCDCKLLPLQINLQDKPMNFEGIEVKCTKPAELARTPIALAKFCCRQPDESKNSSCTDGIKESSDVVLIRIRCLQALLTRPRIKFKVTQSVNKMSFTLEIDDIFPDFALFAFHGKPRSAINLKPYVNTKCWTHVKHLMKISVTDIQDRYVFCLFNKSFESMTPLSCRTFDDNEKFLVDVEHKKLTFFNYAVAIFIICVIIIILSVVIGVTLNLFLSMNCKSSQCSSSRNDSGKSRFSVEPKENERNLRVYRQSSYISVIPTKLASINWQMENQIISEDKDATGDNVVSARKSEPIYVNMIESKENYDRIASSQIEADLNTISRTSVDPKRHIQLESHHNQ